MDIMCFHIYTILNSSFLSGHIYMDIMCFHIYTILNSSFLSGHTVTFSGISHLSKCCVSILMYMYAFTRYIYLVQLIFLYRKEER